MILLPNPTPCADEPGAFEPNTFAWEDWWHPEPSRVALGEQDVHLWQWPLTGTEAEIEAARLLLSRDELARAGRYRFPRHQSSFLLARSMLRRILGQYLDCAPAAVAFAYNLYGRPSLAEGFPPVQFNLSHTDDIAVLAVARQIRLGADLERVRPIDLGISTGLFSEQEKVALASLPEATRLRGFYACWTRKEAICKAEGLGLSLPAADFSVSLLPGQQACITAQPDGLFSAPWQLVDLPLGPEFVGTLCLAAAPTSIKGYLASTSAYQHGHPSMKQA